MCDGRIESDKGRVIDDQQMSPYVIYVCIIHRQVNPQSLEVRVNKTVVRSRRGTDVFEAVNAGGMPGKSTDRVVFALTRRTQDERFPESRGDVAF